MQPVRTLLAAAASLLLLNCGNDDGDDAGSGAAGTAASAGASGTGGGGSSSGGSPGAGSGAGATSGSGTGGGGPIGSCGLGCSLAPAGTCATPEVRVAEIDVGSTVLNNDSEIDLRPLSLAAAPSGGSRLAWMGDDGAVHVAQLDCDDQIVGLPFALPAHDFQDIAADDDGGVVVLTRDAQGGGTLDCGTPSNLCDGGPEPPVPCYDMFMVRHDCAGNEQWAALLTTATAELPPYSTGPTGATAYMIWWYQHHARVAYDGTNYAAYFCDAISVSEGGCINIHQGDRMQVVGPGGQLVSGHQDSFDIGCSHSGFTRIAWDESAGRFVMVCKTDNDNRIAMPAPYRTVYPVDLASSSVGDLVVGGGGYWLTVSNQGSVHLLHFSTGEADQDIVLGAGDAPHLAAFGADHLLAAWQSDTGLVAQVRSVTDGSEVGSPIPIDVPNNRYQSFESFPDGSVGYAAPGTSPTKIRIVRVLPCSG